MLCRQRATLAKRHFIAQWRRNQKRQLNRQNKISSDTSTEKEIGQGDAKKEVAESQCDVADKKAPAVPQRTSSTTTTAAQGLARLGSRTALSFAFAFLRRAWRSGEDSDLCSDLLQVNLKQQ